MVVSPHLDDAVFSCGHFLYAHPSTTVVTVFAGAPDASHEGYNSRTTGKRYAPDAVGVRRVEDRSAMEFVGARPLWLDLYEADYSAYRPRVDYGETIRRELRRVLSDVGAQSVIAPLGLIHVDHVAVSESCLLLATESTLTWYLYTDLPYGFAGRRALSRRMKDVGRRFQLEKYSPYVGEPSIKQRAMKLYESQYVPTRRTNRRGFDMTLVGAEQYWRVEVVRAAT